MKRFLIFIFFAAFTVSVIATDLSHVSSWLYQLQYANLTSIGQTDFDLVVLDYSEDGSDEQVYSASEIAFLKSSVGGEKIVLAYLSIGEAEDYRYYWQDDWTPGNPIWLDEENPEWEGNYKVHYWNPAWQAIIFGYLNKIKNAGFDGIYLDLVDAYESYLQLSSVQSPKAMADFVKAIRDTARSRNPSFLVFGQNASDLIDWEPGYLNVVDGIGQEDLYYGYDGDGIKTPASVTLEIEQHLDQFRAAGKTVLTVDYPFSQSEDFPHFDAATVAKIKDAYSQSKQKGYIPFCAVRELGHLTLNPGHERRYYVGNIATASDANPGTEMLPWATIQHAAENVAAGDTVMIRGGTYSQYFSTAQDGSLGGHIVFKAYPGEKPVLDGSAVSASSTGVRINHDYIDLDGLTIRNWDTGIWMDHAGYGRINDCEVSNVWFGIGACNGTHHFELNRVSLHDFTLYGFDASPSGGDPCHDGVLNDCIAHTGRDPEQNVDGFALGRGPQLNFVFNRCETWGVYDGFDIQVRNVTLNACSAHECAWGGYKVWQDSITLVNCLGYNNDVTNVELDWDDEPGFTVLKNCTFYNGGSWNVYVENPGDQLSIYNTILAGGDNVGMLIYPASYQGDYNLFHTANPSRMIVTPDKEYSLTDIASWIWTAASGQDAHSLVVNSDSAIFADSRIDNLHLKTGSPAIDRAIRNYAPDFDFDGLSRLSDVAPDIGAYEFHGLTDIASEESGCDSKGFRLLQNYPNPFNPVTAIPFEIGKKTRVTLKLFDLLGREIMTLADTQFEPGHHVVDFESGALPSGIYFYQIKMGEAVATRKMVLLK